MTKQQQFEATKLNTFPNQPLYRLDKAWAGVPAGTTVSLISAGQDNVRNERRRTVVVQSGPEKGRPVSGPF